MSTPSFAELIRVFGRIGVLSFGGPAAQIALMHKELVEERPWLNEKQFLAALSFCMFLPGPEAMQLATYAGWLKRGVLGGLIAGTLFVLPGALVVLALALSYAQFGQLPLMQSAFLGVQAAVVIVVMMALRKIAEKALTTRAAYLLAAVSFAMIFFLQLPFPLVVLAAGAIGAIWPLTVQEAPAPTQPSTANRPRFLWRPVLICAALWTLPLGILAAIEQDFLLTLGLFFSKLAVVTFGGAYAVLAYMAQAVVQDHGWLNMPQMMDALGLAETTPGPLILVTQFVATLAGQFQGGWGLALIASLLALWTTFLPCFLWIFAGAPYVDLITRAPRLSAALSAITAAVAGVIANLTIWFAIQVMFSRVNETRLGPVPDLSSFSPEAAGLMPLAALLMLGFKQSMMRTLCLMALAGLGWGLIGPTLI